jgi:hypothetical protein
MAVNSAGAEQASDETGVEGSPSDTGGRELAAPQNNRAQGRSYSFRVHPRALRVGMADGGITAAPT